MAGSRDGSHEETSGPRAHRRQEVGGQLYYCGHAEKLCHNYRKLFSCLTALYSLTLIVVTIGVTGGG